MNPTVQESIARFGPFVLVGGLVGLFVCSRLLAAALSRSDSPAAGLRAIAHFLPIAFASVTALLLGHADIAVGIVFGTSVGAITTVVGFVALAEPIGPAPQRWKRVWPFPLAAALLVFIAGFKGLFHWRDAIALLTEGVLVLSLWGERGETQAARQVEAAGGGHPGAGGAAFGVEHRTSHIAHPIPDPAGPGTSVLPGARPESPTITADDIAAVIDYAAPSGAPDRAGPAHALLLAAQIVLAAGVLGLASWAAVRGTAHVASVLGTGGRFGPAGLSAGALASSIVSLAMVMPMMYGTWRLAARGRSWEPVTTQAGIVLLNLCGLLPLLILLPYAAAVLPALNHWAGDALVYREGLPRLLLFPAAAWRVDNLILVVAGVLLLPVAFGKWALGREEGMTLIAGYFFYLSATLWAAGRM